MYNLCIVKASDDLEDGVNCSNVREESVSQAGPSRSSSSQASDIVDGQVGGYF